MFTIGEFSKISQVGIKTLRYYDEIGLLAPQRVDASSGYRYYTGEQLPRLNRILALKELGLSLDQIKELVDGEISPGMLRSLLQSKLSELGEQSAELARRMELVRTRLANIDKEGAMPEYEVILKEVEPVFVASVRDVLPGYDVAGPTFDRLFDEVSEHIARNGGQIGGYGIALWHDVESDQDIDVEAAILVRKPPREGERVKVHRLPGETVASVTHKGDFSGLSNAYRAGFAWVRSNGYRLSGPIREVYLQYERGGDTSQYVTEVQFPVREGGD